MFNLPFFNKNKTKNMALSHAAQSYSTIDSVTKLPSFISVVDYSVSPVIWTGVEELIDLLMLQDEHKRVYITSSNESLYRYSGIDRFKRNIKSSGLILSGELLVSDDLYQKLLATASEGNEHNRLQIIKSAALSRFKDWIKIALGKGVSDIHIQCTGEIGQIDLRIDGELWPLEDAVMGKYSALHIRESIASAYQNMSVESSNSASLWQPDVDSYTMLQTDINGKKVFMRFQSTAGAKGPKVVLRVFENSSKKAPSLEELGYPDSYINLIRTAQETTSGLVAIAGITNSGKTTLIRSFLESHPDNGRIAINTVEDPVELTIKGSHQRSIQRSFEDTEERAQQKYSGAMAALLRQDIDVGMVGELRDKITANTWLSIAESGHMGVATIHAHRISGILPRLTNNVLGLSRDTVCVPNMINIFIYQGLLPKLCPNCSVSTDDFAKTEGFNTLNGFFTKLEIDPVNLKWRNASGCEMCSYRGTKGSVVVAEMLSPDDKWVELAREGKDIEAAEYERSRGVFDLYSRDLRHRSIVEHGLLRAFDQEIDLRTLSRFEKLNDFADKYLYLKSKAGVN